MTQAKSRSGRFAIGFGICMLGLVIVGLVWALVRFGPFFLAMREGSKQIYAAQERLQKPEMAKSVALKMARFCQSLDQNKDLDAAEVSLIVSELSGTNEISYGSASTNFASLEMGGGFVHFGYTLSLDNDASNQATNIWILTFYSEGKPNRELLRLPILATEVSTGISTKLPALPKPNSP
jgi:hypothetical protein